MWITTKTEEQRQEAVMELAGQVFDEQKALITELYGEHAAEVANYGWNQDIDGQEGTVHLTTKVYLPAGAMVLDTAAQLDEFGIWHEWRPYRPFVATDEERHP